MNTISTLQVKMEVDQWPNEVLSKIETFMRPKGSVSIYYRMDKKEVHG